MLPRALQDEHPHANTISETGVGANVQAGETLMSAFFIMLADVEPAPTALRLLRVCLLVCFGCIIIHWIDATQHQSECA